MPCYQINTIQIEFNLKYPRLIESAAASLGWKIMQQKGGQNVVDEKGITLFTITDNGVSALPQMAGHVNQLKRAYAKQAPQYVARKLGWTKQTRGKKVAYMKGGF